MRGSSRFLFVSAGETTRPAPFTSIYAAAKAGLNHLVTSMAVELGPSGIRVLAMAPGTTRTEMVAAAYTEERFAEIAQSTPLRYAVEHDELARLAVFLTSDLARAITGQMILADAGAFLSHLVMALLAQQRFAFGLVFRALLLLRVHLGVRQKCHEHELGHEHEREREREREQGGRRGHEHEEGHEHEPAHEHAHM